MYNPTGNNEETRKIDTQEIARKSVVAGEEIVLEEQVEENTTKKPMNKKLISVCAIALIAIILCVVLICTNRNPKTGKNEVKSEIEYLCNIGDTYEGLNYTTTKEQLEKIGFFFDHGRGLEGSKIDVSYIKVDGFKDSSIQSRVNDILKESAQSLYDSSMVQDEKVLYEHIYNYTDVYVFNNILSTMYCKEVCDVDGNVEYTYKGVNYQLRDFETIDLKEVFISDADLPSILGENNNSKYQAGTFEYSISPKYIYIPEGKNVEHISLYENIDTVAIYKKYSDNKKMFKKTYNASPYTFTTKKFIETDLYGIADDTLFIDTENSLIKREQYTQDVLDSLNELYKEATNKARNVAYSNPSKRYLVQIIPSIKEVKDEEKNKVTYDLNVEYNQYEIEKEFFNASIAQFIVASENKIYSEDEVVSYFDENTALAADSKLVSSKHEVFEKKVDEKGKEIKEDIKEENKDEKDNKDKTDLENNKDINGLS